MRLLSVGGGLSGEESRRGDLVFVLVEETSSCPFRFCRFGLDGLQSLLRGGLRHTVCVLDAISSSRRLMGCSPPSSLAR